MPETDNMNIIGVRLLTAILLFSLAACGGGGGGVAAPDVEPGPAPANGATPPPAPLPPAISANLYAEADSARATITSVDMEGVAVVHFNLTDDQGQALTGLTSGNVRFHLAKLVPATDGNGSYWQSYINRTKVPAVNADNAPAVQATSERGGELTDHEDGTYSYTSNIDVTTVTDPLAVAYEPLLTHRVGFQFSGGVPINPTFDWVPASNATANIELKNIIATESCNSCHNPLAIHGGGRIEADLCVMCHNPGTSEPNSLESMDMAVMTHRIHMGAELPSVQAGGEYVVWGYRDSKHDYSGLIYPQSPANCAKCHAGTSTADALITADVITAQGDSWAHVATMDSCGSCHDDLDFASHAGGQTDNRGCISCHSVSGVAGSIEDNHRNQTLAASASIAVNVLEVSNTAPGEFPVVTFSVTNPVDNDKAYDITSDALWTNSSSRLSAALAWNNEDFTNTGVSETGTPFYARTNALTDATANGDGTWTLTSATAIPDGSSAPFRAATGSGMLIFEGRAATDAGRIPLDVDPFYFPITDSTAKPRRLLVTDETCNACHGQLAFHGGNRADLEAGCQGCHTPRVATDEGVSIDFKTMVHGIHAAAARVDPLVIRGDPFDTEVVHFPGEISDCTTCHINDSFELPLASGVLASTTDMGADAADPADDVMITPVSAVCASCHDDNLAVSHMEQNGGDFSATESSIDSGASTETCTVCHGPDRISDVKAVHLSPQ